MMNAIDENNFNYLINLETFSDRYSPDWKLELVLTSAESFPITLLSSNVLTGMLLLEQPS